jgi:hypothetical protein
MSENVITTSPMTRRGLLGALAALGSAFAMIPFRVLCAQTKSSKIGCAIVSFHMDQPYLDWSGTAVPYHPPPGARSADVAAHLSEEMLRRHLSA